MQDFFLLPDFKEMYRETFFFLDPVVCIFFFIGFGTALKNKDFSPMLVWVILFGTARFFLPWVAFRVSRYSLPLYPAVLMFAAYGGIKSFSFLTMKMPKHSLLITIVFSAILLYVGSVYCMRGYAVTAINSKTFVGYKEAGIFLTKQGDNRSILTSSPRQIKYFAPRITIYDLPQHRNFEETRRFVTNNKIDFISVDRWSPHQPDWCRNYSFISNGYGPVYKNENIIIFEVR